MIIKKTISDNISEYELREDFQVIRVGKFNDKLVKKVEKGISKAHNTGQPVIPFIIDSSGGSVFSLMSIYESIQSSDLPILTYVKGKALSCGFILLGLGSAGYRYASEHATGMLHEITWGKRDKLSEVESITKYARFQNDYIFKKLATSCGHDEEFFLDLMYEDKRNTDNWLNAEKLKGLNVVDHIGSPSIEMSIDLNYKILSQ